MCSYEYGNQYDKIGASTVQTKDARYTQTALVIYALRYSIAATHYNIMHIGIGIHVSYIDVIKDSGTK